MLFDAHLSKYEPAAHAFVDKQHFNISHKTTPHFFFHLRLNESVTKEWKRVLSVLETIALPTWGWINTRALIALQDKHGATQCKAAQARFFTATPHKKPEPRITVGISITMPYLRGAEATWFKAKLSDSWVAMEKRVVLRRKNKGWRLIARSRCDGT